MCQAHVLRFSCSHGLLMSIEPCRLGPCPFIRTTGAKLPQQPFKCYCCQHRRSSSFTANPREASCTSTIDSLNSVSSSSSTGRPTTPLHRAATAPLPNMIRQPTGTLRYCTSPAARPRSSTRPFSFSCSSGNHFPTPHYADLPGFLPHQSHPCPPCQIQQYRTQGDREVAVQARAEFPHLRCEMLVRNGRAREDWKEKLTLEQYMDEKRTDEREMWVHVLRKWTQDLKKCRVLVSEEEGLALLQ